MKKYIVVFILLLLCSVAYSQSFEDLKAMVPFKDELYDRLQQDFRNMYVGENAKEDADAELDLVVSQMISYTGAVILFRVETNNGGNNIERLIYLCVAGYLTQFSNKGMEVGDGKSIFFSDLFKYYVKATGDRNKGRIEMFSDMFRISAEWGFIRYVDWFCVNINKG